MDFKLLIMAKTCKHPQCQYPVFSTGYCKMHQRDRTDDKWIRSQQKQKEKKSFSSIKQKPREATGEAILFQALFTTRKHISFISGLPIENINHCNCAHVLAKGQNKYPKFKLLDRNIVFLTGEEHDLYDNGTEDKRREYEAFMHNHGLECNWKKLFDLRDELKKEYLCIV